MGRIAPQLGVVVAWLGLGSLLVACDPVSFDVDTTTDFVDANPGDGECAGVNGGCSLRAAIQETNALPTPSNVTIRLQSSGTYSIDLDVNGARGLVIEGGGKVVNLLGCCSDPSQTTIEPDFASRIFTIEGGITSLRRVRLTGGRAPDAPLSDGEVKDGGAIHASGPGTQLWLDEVVLEANEAERQGGAVWIANDTATVLDIADSVIRSNTASSGGVGGAGGVHSGASTSVADTLFQGNSGNGGGLRLHEDDGVAQPDHQVQRSTFRNNMSPNSGAGGGMRVDVNDGRVVVSDSTFSENDTTGSSGAAVMVSSGRAELVHVTMTRNSAVSEGHALFVSSGASARLRASLIAQNPDLGVGGDSEVDCGATGELVLDGFNLVDVVDEACDATPQSSDEVGPVDGGLLGYTELPIGHHPLAADSAAIDHAEFFCEGFDQIGNPRPINGDGDAITRCDAGSIEYQTD